MRKLARFFSQSLAFIFNLLPWSANVYMAKIFSFLWVDLFKIRKQVVFDNIEIAFPNASVHMKKKWMQQSIFYLSRSVFDILRIPYLNDAWIDKNVTLHIDPSFDNKKCCLFLTLHLGSGDLAAAILSRNIIPLSVISKRFKNEFIDEFWFSLRTQSNAEFIDAHGKQNAFEILKALKRNRAVTFVLDQFMGKPFGAETKFFGRTTGTAYGLALFAQKTKVPVIPVYTYWDSENKLHIQIDKTVDLSDIKYENKEQLNIEITNRFNQTLENIIKLHPEQWMWVHKRWKDFE